MTSRDFAYWLMGYFELKGEPTGMTAEQELQIRAHLALVFKHEIDPAMGDAEHQAELNEIHGPATATPQIPPKPHMPIFPHSDVTLRC